jgi:hypothetical protein
MTTSGDSVEIRAINICVRHVTQKTTFCGGVRCAWPLCVVSHVVLLACLHNQYCTVLRCNNSRDIIKFPLTVFLCTDVFV